MSATHLDSRTWLVWGLAAMLPALVGRNPWLLGEVLLIVVVVRTVWMPRAHGHGLGWFLRIALVLLAVSVVFNVLTVDAGDRVLATIPESWPVIGGPVTLNALVYGLVSALALFSLVLTGITVAGLVRWVDLFHALPQRLAPIAVTGSVAWAFLPQTAVAWRHIREAQEMRGFRFRGARDFGPIIVPLLAGGLERSLAMAEALEARGFGGAAALSNRTHRRTIGGVALIGFLVSMATAAYCLAVGRGEFALISTAAGAASLVAWLRLDPPPEARRTRYRPAAFGAVDFIVGAAAIISGAAVVGWALREPQSLAFAVYPSLAWPAVEPVLMALLALLMVPAFVAAPVEADR